MIAPVFVVRLIAVPPEPVTDVLAKLNAPLEVFTLMPIPVGLVMVVEPLVKIPATLVKIALPVVALLWNRYLQCSPSSVPVVRVQRLTVTVQRHI